MKTFEELKNAVGKYLVRNFYGTEEHLRHLIKVTMRKDSYEATYARCEFALRAPDGGNVILDIYDNDLAHLSLANERKEENMLALNIGKEVWHTFKDSRDGRWYYYTRDNLGGERYFLTVEEIATLEDKTVLDRLHEAMTNKEIIED